MLHTHANTEDKPVHEITATSAYGFGTSEYNKLPEEVIPEIPKEHQDQYGIFDFNQTGMLEVEKIDATSTLEDDLEAAEMATNDGVPIIPINELPENFERRYFGWLDTPRNRYRIKKFADATSPTSRSHD